MILFFLVFTTVVLLCIYTTAVFIKEGEWEAVIKTILAGCVYVVFAIVVYYLKISPLTQIYVGIQAIAGIVLLIPYRKKRPIQDLDSTVKYDERNIMFSRNELVPGTERYDKYYHDNPDHLEPDNAFRKLPGLLSPDAKYYHRDGFTVAKNYFTTIKKFHPLVEGEVEPVTTEVDPDDLSSFLIKWIKELGALECGITELKPYHLYSIKGRGDSYGNPVVNRHQLAIAFTMEMDHEMVKAAPFAPIVMESSKQYLNGARIATLVAQYLRKIGFDSRAHIDGNYQVVCPLVARDAGLGEIGRMGLLMTPKHGPRVRLGVITTSAPVIATRKKVDYSVEYFCLYCKKCAVCCPSRSISSDAPKNNTGGKRWKIDSESCFTYWCNVGTDCGRCMAVCPYSHPDTMFHSLIRWGIKNNYFFLRLAIYLDDFFYGKKPRSKKIPGWLNNN